MTPRLRPALALAAVALAAGVGVDRALARTAVPAIAPQALDATAGRWDWLQGTTWCVPAPNLPAIMVLGTERRTVPVADQTVYHISNYRAGYFTGETAVSLGGEAPTCLTLAGSVTPEGTVLLTFTPRDPDARTTVTQGMGEMRLKNGQWTMENQMSSGPSALLQIIHWAYMVQTRPGDRNWQSLPGLGISVPDFLGQCAK